MTRLRKIVGFSYILPLMVAGLLFSTVVSVFSLDPPPGYTLYNGYIGEIDCFVDTSDGNKEETVLHFYNDTELTSPQPPQGGGRLIIRGYEFGGWSNGKDPIGIVETALSAQIQRTKVQYAFYDPAYGYDKILLFIQPYDDPDDIASLFDGFSFYDIYNSISGLSVDLDGQLATVNNIQSQSVDILARVNTLKTTIDSQGTLLASINTKTGDIDNKVNSIGTVVGNHTTAFTGLSTTIGNIDSKNNNIISKASGININVGGANTYLIGEINTINTRLASEGVLLTNIWNKLNTTQ